MIKDKNISWNVKREFIAAHLMSGLSVDRTASLANGAPVFQEIAAAAEISGLAINQAGDEINHNWKLPWDLDREKPIAARIYFAHGSTGATDNPDWLVSMKGWKADEALSDPASSADETLTFPALAVSAANPSLELTAWQKTGLSPFDADDLFALLCIECNGLGSATGDEISLLGIELAYTVKACGDSPKRDDTTLTLDNLARY